jgi:hypothetical protein
LINRTDVFDERDRDFRPKPRFRQGGKLRESEWRLEWRELGQVVVFTGEDDDNGQKHLILTTTQVSYWENNAPPAAMRVCFILFSHRFMTSNSYACMSLIR